MLTSVGYPAVIHHIEKQENFEKTVTESMDEAILYQDPNILLKFLRTWLMNHLTEDHVEYTAYFDKLK